MPSPLSQASTSAHGAGEVDSSAVELSPKELLAQIVAAFDPSALRCACLITVPQFGRESGKPQRLWFSSSDSGITDRGIAAWVERCAKNLPLRQSEQRSESIEGQPATAVELPIIGQFDRPVGRIGFVATAAELPIERITQLANRHALVIRNAKLERFLRLMAELPKLQGPPDEAFTQAVMEECRDAVGSRDIALWRYNEKSDLLEYVTATRNFNIDLKKGKGVAGTCLAESKIIRIDDLLDPTEVRLHCPAGLEHEDVVRQLGWHSAVFIPIGLGRFSSGVFAAYSGRPHGLNDVDISIATAFAQKLEFVYTIHETDRVMKLHSRLTKIAPAFDAALLAVGKLHDATDALANARNSLSILMSQHEKLDISAVDSFIKSAQDLLLTFRNGVKFSQPENHRPKAHPVRERLNNLIMRSKTAAYAKKIQLTFSCPESLHATMDITKVERALRNLIENAMDALERTRGQGAINVAVSLADAGRLDISVEDNGPGISPEDKPRVKELFYTTKGEAGFGIGLYLANQCALAHRGTLEIDSIQGRNSYTRMTLMIPQ